MEEIILKPIGYIESPFEDRKGTPRQSIHAKDIPALIKINEEYREGLNNLEKFDYIIVIFYFDRVKEYDLLTKTPWSEEKRGVFATRSPRRPNPIGMSVVKLVKIEDTTLYIEGVDMLNNTPVIDIKGYVPSLNP